EAVELYRGDLLSGVSLHGALEFDEWVAARREHLRQLVIHARDKLAEHAIEQADLSGGIEHLHHLLDIDPWREDAHRRLMHLLVRAGRRNAALLHYEQCRRFLMEELG